MSRDERDNMYERILVPVDGSPFSEDAIPYARGLAEASGARLTLLRIAENGSAVESEEYLHYLAAKTNAETCLISSHGSVPKDILDEADRVPGTLVAITSHGRGGVLNALLGSVAREIVHASHGPVLVYRPDGESNGLEAVRISSVLLPLDGTRLSESMKPEAAKWARALGAILTVVQVVPAGNKADPLLASHDVLDSSYVSSHARDISREFGIDASWEVLHGDPVDSLERYIGGRRDVLAVMATRQQTAVKAAVLGSVTSGMVHRVGIPIIVQAPVKERVAAQ